MCGISGIINISGKPVEELTLKSMMGSMKHRGPDDEGIFVEGNAGLGFVRLSIIDLSAGGHQPMMDRDSRYVMVYNGEIYNYIELKQELAGLGYAFVSESDTEVLLNAYLQWGENCLDHLNGMFAFAVYDRKNRSLFAARDRYGIKPFYYYMDGDSFIFCSEIPALLTVVPFRPEIDRASVYNYLVFNRTDQDENTFFRKIRKLQHGSVLQLCNGSLRIKKWYELRNRLNAPFSGQDEYLELFSDSVRLRLRSDVPVGVCLSGGIDSSSIVSVLLKYHAKKDLSTFSAVYGKGEKADESRFIREYEGILSDMHFTWPSADTLLKDRESFVRAHGEPVPSTAPYAHFKVMELASKKVVVTLDGQGADEQLAGYHYFFGFYFLELLRKFRMIRLLNEVSAYRRVHHSSYGLKTLGFFLLPAGLKNSARVGEKDYLSHDFIRQFSGHNTIVSGLYSSLKLGEALLDHFEYKLEHLLKWEDRNSMWFSLESRVPFLDYRLVEKTLSLPSSEIIRKGTTKHILRESMRGVLPEAIRIRSDKIGFLTPEDSWFREPPFRDLILDILSSKSFLEREFFNAGKVRQQYEKHLSGKLNISKEIWKWIHLEMWCRMFIDPSGSRTKSVH